jgi:carboxylesterase type B
LNTILEPITGEDYYKIYFGPLIDNDIIVRSGNAQLLDGSFVKVPYILGINSDDGTDFPAFGINDNSDFTAFFSGFGIPNDTLSQIETLYPDSPDTDIPLSSPGRFNDTIGLQFKRSATLIGDLFFQAPRRLASQQWVKHTNASLYSYRFNAIPNGIPDYFGVTHFQDVPFVFHNVRGAGYPDVDPPYFGPDPFANRPESFVQLSTLMSRMWANFISDGNPNFQQRKFFKCRLPSVLLISTL